MTRRWVVARRHRVLLLLVLCSVLYWIAAWAWVGADTVAPGSAGEHDVVKMLHELELVTKATWLWVLGGLVAHLLLIGFTSVRGDKEGRAGVVWSLVVHTVFCLSWGVVRF